jgi:tetratricopeptide (TPR) repeat protein
MDFEDGGADRHRKRRVRPKYLAAFLAVIAALGAYWYSLVERRAQARTLNEALSKLGNLVADGIEESRNANALLANRLEAVSSELTDQVKSSRADAASRIRGVEQRVSGRVEDLSVKVSSVDEKVATVDEKVASVDERVANVNDKVLNVDEKVVSVDEKMSAITGAGSGDSQAATSISPLDLPTERALRSGRAAYASGRYAEAAAAYREAYKLNPDNKEARLFAAISGFYTAPSDSTAYPSLERALNAALNEDPYNAPVLRAYARLSTEKGAWSSSLEYYSRLDALGKADAASLAEAALAARYIGDAEKERHFTERLP